MDHTITLEALAQSNKALGISIDTVWVLLAAALVFLMQAGFALVEAGFTRSKNTVNILMKNLIDFAVGSLLFWAIGFTI
ncbi:Ammonium transporter, partial [hydrothermal vent metagenome]